MVYYMSQILKKGPRGLARVSDFVLEHVLSLFVAVLFMSSIGVDTVAKAMRVDAEKVAGASEGGASAPVQVLLNDDIHKLCSDS